MDNYVSSVLNLIIKNFHISPSSQSSNTNIVPLSALSTLSTPPSSCSTSSISSSSSSSIPITFTKHDILYILFQLIFLHYGYQPLHTLSSSCSVIFDSKYNHEHNNSTIHSNIINFLCTNRINIENKPINGIYSTIYYGFPYLSINDYHTPSTNASPLVQTTNNISNISHLSSQTSTTFSSSSELSNNLSPIDNYSLPSIMIRMLSFGDTFRISATLNIPSNLTNNSSNNNTIPSLFLSIPLTNPFQQFAIPFAAYNEMIYSLGYRIYNTFILPYTNILSTIQQQLYFPLYISPITIFYNSTIGTNSNTTTSTPSSAASIPSLITLPNEVTTNILSFLMIKDLSILDTVCKSLQEEINNEELWKNHYSQIIQLYSTTTSNHQINRKLDYYTNSSTGMNIRTSQRNTPETLHTSSSSSTTTTTTNNTSSIEHQQRQQNNTESNVYVRFIENIRRKYSISMDETFDEFLSTAIEALSTENQSKLTKNPSLHTPDRSNPRNTVSLPTCIPSSNNTGLSRSAMEIFLSWLQPSSSISTSSVRTASTTTSILPPISNFCFTRRIFRKVQKNFQTYKNELQERYAYIRPPNYELWTMNDVYHSNTFRPLRLPTRIRYNYDNILWDDSNNN